MPGLYVSATRPRSSTGVGTRPYVVGPFENLPEAEKYADWMFAFHYENIEIEEHDA